MRKVSFLPAQDGAHQSQEAEIIHADPNRVTRVRRRREHAAASAFQHASHYYLSVRAELAVSSCVTSSVGCSSQVFDESLWVPAFGGPLDQIANLQPMDGAVHFFGLIFCPLSFTSLLQTLGDASGRARVRQPANGQTLRPALHRFQFAGNVLFGRTRQRRGDPHSPAIVGFDYNFIRTEEIRVGQEKSQFRRSLAAASGLEEEAVATEDFVASVGRVSCGGCHVVCRELKTTQVPFSGGSSGASSNILTERGGLLGGPAIAAVDDLDVDVVVGVGFQVDSHVTVRRRAGQ